MMRAIITAVAVTVLAMAAGNALTEGSAGSAVRVVIYEDLQCPDCAQFRVMLDQKLLPRFGSKVAFEHLDFPLPKHKWARDAAIASRYFGTISPALAIEWRRYAMAHQGDITTENFRDKLAAWSNEKGGGADKALAALKSPDLATAVDRDYQEGVARGIAHTPTVLVDGEPFVETFSYEDISASIEKALAAH